MSDLAGRKVKTIDDALRVHCDRDLNSVSCPLDKGAEIQLGIVSELEGREWVEASLPDGTTGYFLGAAVRSHTDIRKTTPSGYAARTGTAELAASQPKREAGSGKRSGTASIIGWALIVIAVPVLVWYGPAAFFFLITLGAGLIRAWSTKFIVTILACIVLVTMLSRIQMGKYADRARVTRAHAQLRDFTGALGMYKRDNGNFPTTEEGLQALRVKPADATQWNGPFMLQIPKDPWGHDWVYKFPGDHGDEPDIISYGADGQPGGDGINADIVSWKENAP